MHSLTSLSSASLLRAHIRQDVSLIFISESEPGWTFASLRKYSYICVLFLGFFSFLPGSGYALEQKQEFIVTAYYSPVEGQSWYYKGSYEAEKRLNGEGTHGASGKGVFVGMIAAPKTYEFGTRIFFEGLGVGIVEDRGGAIVKAGERGQSGDRIDIWMGSGESGLRRAIAWGKRKVTGTITTDETKALLNFRDIDTGKVDLNMYGRVLGGSSSYLSDEIIAMFSDLGYDSYEDVRAMIIEFQKDHAIIKDETDEGAGVYGPKTRAAIVKEHARYRELRDAELQKIELEKAMLISAREQWDTAKKIAERKVEAIGSPKRGDKGTHIKDLQVALKSNGHFKGRPTGTMSGPTILALKSLQKSQGITPSGTIDSPTKEALLGIITDSI